MKHWDYPYTDLLLDVVNLAIGFLSGGHLYMSERNSIVGLFPVPIPRVLHRGWGVSRPITYIRHRLNCVHPTDLRASHLLERSASDGDPRRGHFEVVKS